jgi:membrane protein implicated in regulation of membrane protease activity
MTEEKNDKVYPVKSIHDFLFELDKEWSKFRNGTLIGLISSGILFVIVLWLILRTRVFGLGLIDFIFLLIAGVFLAYSIYAMFAQYRFFNRWERRIGLLIHLEEQILAGKLDEKDA